MRKAYNEYEKAKKEEDNGQKKAKAEHCWFGDF
jgi:hypothetical protein